MMEAAGKPCCRGQRRATALNPGGRWWKHRPSPPTAKDWVQTLTAPHTAGGEEHGEGVDSCFQHISTEWPGPPVANIRLLRQSSSVDSSWNPEVSASALSVQPSPAILQWDGAQGRKMSEGNPGFSRHSCWPSPGQALLHCQGRAP